MSAAKALSFSSWSHWVSELILDEWAVAEYTVFIDWNSRNQSQSIDNHANGIEVILKQA